MLVPPLISNLIPQSRSYEPPREFRAEYLGSETDNYFGGYLGYLMVSDKTGGKFGTLPSESSKTNENIYKKVIGWLPQVSKRQRLPGSFSCKGYNEEERLSVPFTKSFETTEKMLEAYKKLNPRNYNGFDNSMCYWVRDPELFEITDVQMDDMRKPLKVKGTGWTRSYRMKTQGIMIQAAALSRASNFQFPHDLLYTNDTDPVVLPQTLAPFPLTLKFDYLPQNKNSSGPKSGFSMTFNWLFASLVLSLLTPLFTQRPVLERSEGLVDLATMMGLSRIAHWLGHLVLDFSIYLFYYILILIIAAASSKDVILAMLHPWVLFSCLVYGVTCVFTSYFFSFFFRSPRTALIMSYIYALVQIAIVAVFNFLLTPVTSNFPAFLMIWPSFNFYRLTWIGMLQASYEVHMPAYTPVLRDSFLALFFETIILVLIVFLLDRYAPTKMGHRGTSLNLITDFFLDVYGKFKKLIRRKKVRRNGEYLDDHDSGSSSDDLEDSIENGALLRSSGSDMGSEVYKGSVKIDPRVAQEKQMIRNGQTGDAVMVLRDVRKVYAEGSKKFTAVAGVSFALREGDCFGLLGPNGAGKSTLVAIMSGILTPTSGSVTIAKSKGRCAIGLCPQDDLFYADLTVEEHLLFYSRLKGKGKGEDQAAVDQILADVSMQNERRLRASSLSGGQKRRLSVASALCGDPMVVFLDEPSSSLDPGSRIGLWEIIQSVSKTRCTLLTTHSMDEAEILCSRIGIIKDGHMVCLGSSSQLKNTYGEGYKLQLLMTPAADPQNILKNIASIAPSAFIVSQKHDLLSIQLGQNVLLSTVSSIVEKHKKEWSISEWSLARNGLDEVFLSIVEDRGASPSAFGYGTNIEADHAESSMDV